MDLKLLVKSVEDNKEFKEWHKEHDDFCLASIFNVAGQGWTLGYYSEKDDEMVTITSKPIKINPPDQVFKKEESITPLDIESIGLPLDDVDMIVNEIVSKHYLAHKINKKIIILNNQKVPMYNITLITATFNVINIKIDAVASKVVKHEMSSALSFQEK